MAGVFCSVNHTCTRTTCCLILLVSASWLVAGDGETQDWNRWMISRRQMQQTTSTAPCEIDSQGRCITPRPQCPSSNLIANGGFETGNFAFFTQSGATALVTDSGQSHSGMFHASFGSSYDNAILSQDLPDCAAVNCVLSFYLYNGVDCEPGDCFFSVTAGASSLFDSDSQASLTQHTEGYQQLSSHFMLGGDPSQALTFTVKNRLAAYLLDDVSVTCST